MKTWKQMNLWLAKRTIRERSYNMNNITGHIARMLALTAVLAVAVMTWAAPVEGREVKRIEASGVAKIVGEEGDLLTAIVCGQSTPGGSFVGILHARLVGYDGVATSHADVWLEYEDGSTFVFTYAAAVTPLGLEFGGWRAIEGTGQFQGVIGGGGTLWAEFQSPHKAVFNLSGTVVLP